MVLVLLFASVERFDVSRMQDFFGVFSYPEQFFVFSVPLTKKKCALSEVSPHKISPNWPIRRAETTVCCYRVESDRDAEDRPTDEGGQAQHDGGGDDFEDRVQFLQEEADEDAVEGDVEDDGQDEGLADRGEGAGGEGAGEVALEEQDQDVPEDRVDVEEDVLEHDVDVAAALLDEELVVDPGEDAGDSLADDEGDAHAEGSE